MSATLLLTGLGMCAVAVLYMGVVTMFSWYNRWCDTVFMLIGMGGGLAFIVGLFTR